MMKKWLVKGQNSRKKEFSDGREEWPGRKKSWNKERSEERVVKAHFHFMQTSLCSTSVSSDHPFLCAFFP
jgi:hypothetical protein